MLEDDEYSSDTSDEDFVPEENVDDQESEDEDDEVNESEEYESPKGKKRKLNRKMKENKRKKNKRKNPLIVKLQPQESTVDETAPKIDEAEDAKKADSLWADFLADVDEKPTEETKPKTKNSWVSLLDPNKKSSKSSSSSKGCTPPNSSKLANAKSAVPKDIPESSKVKITKIFEFAGEEVRVEEEVTADSVEAKLSTQSQNGSREGRSSDSGVKKNHGLSTVLSLLDSKKKKLSTLEKTKLDWINFKSSEGIEEELQTHLRSKEGYLEKQAFLERADLRQFEIERKMRMNRRNNK